MSNETWHYGIQTKIEGTLNLHHALRGHDSELDFFLLTSSTSGVIGNALLANYCAANSFLDWAARWRRAQGLPAISIGLGMISEVGYLHDNPDVETRLSRKGMKFFNEDEMLQVIDIALSHNSSFSALPWQRHCNDDLARSHILNGLEATEVEDMYQRGSSEDRFIDPNVFDPRAALLAGSLFRSIRAFDSGKSAGFIDSKSLNDIPPQIVQEMESKSIGIREAVENELLRKISTLILMPVEAVEAPKPLTSFGLDSMLATELRTFLLDTLGVDVPFMSLLHDRTSVKSLAQSIASQIEEGGQ